MRSVLVCPAERPGFANIAHRRPLALLPLLGRAVLDYWVQHVVALGATHVTVVAADRPAEIARHLAHGARWGVEAEVISVAHEPDRAEAFRRFREDEPGQWLAAPCDLAVLDHLPMLPRHRPFADLAAWFVTARDLIPHAPTPDRVGLRELLPGVWAGLRTHVAPTAQLIAPCWIGDDAYVGPGVQLGPGTVLEDRVFVEAGACIAESVIGPDTFVGGITEIRHSFAWGEQLINHRTGSSLRVADDFLLCSLESRPLGFTPVAWWRRRAESFARVIASPAAALLRREPLTPPDAPRAVRPRIAP